MTQRTQGSRGGWLEASQRPQTTEVSWRRPHVEPTLERIRRLAATDQVEFTVHAREQMREDGLRRMEVQNGLASPRLRPVEDYPEDQRGHSCQVAFDLPGRREIHAVCAIVLRDGKPTLVVITVWQVD